MGAVTKTPDPYDPCYCHSGKKYKFCHYPLDKASGIERLKISLRTYLERWKANAENFRSQGCYEWMASQIQPFQPKRVLDIGCGDGSGIIALSSILKSPQILSLDDNRECLEHARDRCVSGGLKPDCIDRFVVSAQGQSHLISTAHSKFRFESQITLIEGDLLWDKDLLEFILALPKFDAITVWLLGTYDIKMECSNTAHLRAFSEVGKYRHLSHERMYQLAGQILKPGGLIHIVERGISIDADKLREMSVEEHSDLSAGTGLLLQAYAMRNYTEASGTNRVTMENRHSANSAVQSQTPLALSSIISVKG
jgi:SAM-dependent methyltransferase